MSLDDDDLRYRDPMLTCSNRQCRHVHRVHERPRDPQTGYVLCPLCGCRLFVECEVTGHAA